MQRRFEMYRVRDDVPRAVVDEFTGILRQCGDFIPQLLDSFAAKIPAERGVNFIWEHAYPSADAYEDYMCHPYHICVLDRYLLPDAPGLITEPDDSQLGLLGYEVGEPVYRLGEGVRRLVIFNVDPSAPAERVDALLGEMRDTPRHSPEMLVSIAESNTMGAEWFPGAWSHIWEQAFESERSMRSYLEGDSPLARAERAGLKDGVASVIERSLHLHYGLTGAGATHSKD
jgi:hypothetical protein